MEKVITYRHNVMGIQSLDAFLGIKGGCHMGRRDVYFVRAIGWKPGAALADVIAEIDRRMEREMESRRLFYKRAGRLAFMPTRGDMDFYEEQFAALKSGKEIYVKSLKGNAAFGSALAFACRDALDKYRLIKKNATQSMEKNLAVKLLYWTDSVLGGMLSEWNERKCYKVLADNVVKEQEYLFYYMLTMIGCDVLLFQSREDIRTADEVKCLSLELKLGGFCETAFPEYRPYPYQGRKPSEAGAETETERKPALGGRLVSGEKSIPERKPVSGVKPAPEGKPMSRIRIEQVRKPESKPESKADASREKSFEELALLASSIVMIEVHDRGGKPVGTGSGVMIGKDGFILTNNHVTRGGYSFSVRIEEDSAVYRTNEIIKYNSVFDLSVIRIDRRLSPLPVYRGVKKLARGQKVVAIGSPLGLFNSVSDGIISGFREIDSVDMIQFTAPISHGSSGGAVLNMQGEIIGISTAGFDGGQNINLAVGYETINLFVRGLTG